MRLLGYYRAWLCRGGVGFLLLASIAVGQIAKDLPPGTAAEEVIRLYGWPTGKVASQGREIWTYPDFQLTLLDGRVRNVSAHPPGPSNPSSRPARQPELPLARAEPPPVGIIAPPSTAQKQPLRSTVNPPATAPAKMKSVPPLTRPAPGESDYLELKPQTRPPPPSPRATWGWYGLGLALVAVLVGAAGLWLWRLKRARRSIDPLPALDAGSARSWEQNVAAQLARSTGGQNAAAAASSPPPPSHQDLTIDLLRSLEWKRFELIAERYFAATGLHAKRSGTGADGGVDLRLHMAKDLPPDSLVQCKAWGGELIGVSLVRELRGVMAAEGVSKGIFMTTSDFTPDARAFAGANGITVMNALELVTRFQSLAVADRRKILAEVTEGDYTTPTCPTCDVKLVLRDGGKTGRSFWGCRRYPHCRYTMVPRGR